MLFLISMKDDGLWALWETAFFAVFQAPVGALFASMGAAASTAPRGGAGPGRAGHGRGGLEPGAAPVPARTRVAGFGRAGRKRSRVVRPVIGRHQTERGSGHESGLPVRVEGRRRLRIESPLRSSL